MKNNSKDSVETLFKSKNKDLLRYLKARSSSSLETEDIAQEAYIRLLRVNRKELIRNSEAYLYRIAANVAYEFRLKQEKSGGNYSHDIPDDVEVTDDISVEETIQLKQQVEDLEKVLSTLSHKCRAAFVLHKRDGFTYREIALRLGISTNMVKKYLSTALMHCRSQLTED